MVMLYCHTQTRFRPGPDAPRDSPYLVNYPEEGPSFSGGGHNLAPASRSLEPACLAPGWDAGT